ncbi:hypothetical protein [Streptococcus intermedius]
MNKMFAKISKLPNRVILKFLKYTNISLFAIAVFSLIYYWYHFIKDDITVWSLYFSIFLAFLSLYLVFLNTKFYQRVLDYILVYNVDLKKYLDIHNLMFQKASQTSKEQQQNIFLFTEGQVKYYKGQFQESMINMSMIDDTRMQEKYRVKFLLRKYNFELLCCIFQCNIELYHQLKLELTGLALSLPSDKGLQENILEVAEAVYNLVIKKVNTDYFDKHESKNKLERITYTYYAALNAQLKGEEARTRELFESIAQENPELFYVQEAKRYLEEN